MVLPSAGRNHAGGVYLEPVPFIFVDRGSREGTKHLLMVHCDYICDKEAGTPDFSIFTVSCLVRVIQPATPSGCYQRKSSCHLAVLSRSYFLKGKNITFSTGKKKKKAVWLFFQPRHFVLTQFCSTATVLHNWACHFSLLYLLWLSS